jgi:hypothetical protein
MRIAYYHFAGERGGRPLCSVRRPDSDARAVSPANALRMIQMSQGSSPQGPTMPGVDSHPSSNQWLIQPYEFKRLKHNRVIAGIALQILKLRTRRLEKVIFTATTGRSGTLTLSKLFAAVPGCRAVHEGYPIMNGPVLRAASFADTPLVDRVYRRIKAVNIRRAAVGHRYYVEANHLFIKTFIRNAIDDFGERLAIVHLVRPAVEVATSIYCLQDYPGTARGNYWWLDYRAPSNLISLPDLLATDSEFSHPFYKALWYWHEIEARIALWRTRMPAVKVVRFETQWLNDRERVSELLDALGMQYDKASIDATVGRKEHTKEDQKFATGLAPGAAEQMAARFRALLEGIRLPGGDVHSCGANHGRRPAPHRPGEKKWI